MLFVMVDGEQSERRYLRVHENGEWEMTHSLQVATVFRLEWVKQRSVATHDGQMAIIPEVPGSTPSYMKPASVEYRLTE